MNIGELAETYFWEPIRWNIVKEIYRFTRKNCSEYTWVKDLPNIEKGMPLCNFNDEYCPYKNRIFKPRQTVKGGGFNWLKGKEYVVCGNYEKT